MGIREELCEHFGDDLLFANGYDNAIIGVCSGHDSGRVVYSVKKMIEIWKSVVNKMVIVRHVIDEIKDWKITKLCKPYR